MNETDPLDQWTEPAEITEVSFSGTLRFSCCHKTYTVQGENRSEVQCQVCGTLYGIALLIRLQPADDHPFIKGTRVRPKERLQVKAGATTVVLEPSQVYEATQDSHGALNVPPGNQPVLVEVRGDRGIRKLVAIVPAEQLIAAE
jgi:hypothetical protein